MQFASFGARLLGTLLDGLFFLLCCIPFAIPAVVMIRQSVEGCVTVDRVDGTTDLVCPPGYPDGASLGGGIAIAAVGLIVLVLFFTGMVARSGQTWGRRIAHVKVVRASDGAAPGWGRAIGRALFANFISGQICWLGYLWMLWDGENRTWHDMVAGTRVVRA